LPFYGFSPIFIFLSRVSGPNHGGSGDRDFQRSSSRIRDTLNRPILFFYAAIGFSYNSRYDQKIIIEINWRRAMGAPGGEADESAPIEDF